jgi:hypothetical protein
MNPYGGISSPYLERANHYSCTIVNNLSRLPCESKIAIFESLPNLVSSSSVWTKAILLANILSSLRAVPVS